MTAVMEPVTETCVDCDGWGTIEVRHPRYGALDCASPTIDVKCSHCGGSGRTVQRELTVDRANTTEDPAYDKTISTDNGDFHLFHELNEDGDYDAWAVCTTCGKSVTHPERDEDGVALHGCADSRVRA